MTFSGKTEKGKILQNPVGFYEILKQGFQINSPFKSGGFFTELLPPKQAADNTCPNKGFMVGGQFRLTADKNIVKMEPEGGQAAYFFGLPSAPGCDARIKGNKRRKTDKRGVAS